MGSSRSRWLLGCTLGCFLLSACAGRSKPSKKPDEEQPSGAAVLLSASVSDATISSVPSIARTAPCESLPVLWLRDVNSQRRASLRLYDGDGNVDDEAATVVDDLCADRRRKGETRAMRIDRRLIQIVARSAYHFGKHEIQIVSCYRQPTRRREGLHAQGRAIDYRLDDVDSRALASYLRKIAKLGVGLYPHRKTQYVHLDVRDASYHWLDASPPGRHWRGKSIGSRALIALDAAYRRRDDWPEGFGSSTWESPVAE